MIKSIKVMLLPNNQQNTKLFQTASASRYAYNWTVALQMGHFEKTGKYLTDSDVRKMFTQHKEENQWLYHSSNNATKQAMKDCCNAFFRFVSEKKKTNYKPYSKKQMEHAARIGKKLTRYDMQHHPKFKKKGKAEPKFYMDTDKIEFSTIHVKLEKIADSKRKNRAKANWMKLAEKNRVPIDAKYRNPRLSFDWVHWWISVGIECENNIEIFSNDGIGIDVGVKDLAILSDKDQTKYENINKTKTVKRLEQKQRRLQRSISRKYNRNKEGESYKKTSNIIKSEKQHLKLNQRLAGIRRNHVHQTTTEIVKTKPSYIVVEDLNVQGMMKNKHLAKAVQEQCLYEFSRQIEYKANWNGIKFIEADRYYPSSKTCSCCGKVKTNLKLKDRTYICEECGLVVDRDYNAAINLREYGKLLA